MPPGAFALVMATGIVSIAAYHTGHLDLSWSLWALAAAAYLALVALVVRRGTKIRRVEALTFVAGSGVLGSRVALSGHLDAALALWALAAAAYALLLGPVLVDLVDRREARLSGSALLAVVAPESLAVLGGLLGRRLDARPLQLAAEALWALGLLAYALLIPGIARRLARGSFHPDDWIAMGALAIATLAAAQLRQGLASILIWAAATAWLPPIVAADALRGPRRYELRRWATVFPLGMYSAASYDAGAVGGLPSLIEVGRIEFWAAAAAWTLAAAGLARQLARSRG